MRDGRCRREAETAGVRLMLPMWDRRCRRGVEAANVELTTRGQRRAREGRRRPDTGRGFDIPKRRPLEYPAASL